MKNEGWVSHLCTVFSNGSSNYFITENQRYQQNSGICEICYRNKIGEYTGIHVRKDYVIEEHEFYGCCTSCVMEQFLETIGDK